MIPRLWLYVIAVCACVAIASAGYHSIYKRGYNDAMTKVAAETAKKDAEYRAKEQSWVKQSEDARNEATKRQQTIQHDADSARAAADSLRNQLADAKRAVPTASADAVRNYVDTLSDVFSDCAEKYRSLAREADEQSADKQTLMQAWPK